MFGVLQEYVWAKQVRQNFDPYTRQRSYTKTRDYRGKRHFRIDIQLYFSSKLNYYFFNCASHFVSYYKERNKRTSNEHRSVYIISLQLHVSTSRRHHQVSFKTF